LFRDKEKQLQDRLARVLEAMSKENEKGTDNVQLNEDLELFTKRRNQENANEKQAAEELNKVLENFRKKIARQSQIREQLEEERLRCRTVKIAEVRPPTFDRLENLLTQTLEENAGIWDLIKEEEEKHVGYRETRRQLEQEACESYDESSVMELGVHEHRIRRQNQLSKKSREFSTAMENLTGRIGVAKAKVSSRKSTVQAKKSYLDRICSAIGCKAIGDELVVMKKRGFQAKDRNENTKRAIRHFEWLLPRVEGMKERFAFAEGAGSPDSLVCEWRVELDLRNYDRRILGGFFFCICMFIKFCF
jgi:hypothetical protein